MSDNIKVVVKVRPFISREIEEKLSHQWRVKENTIYQLDSLGKDTGACYTFDKVYDESTKSSRIYRDIAKPIVEAAIEGINGTIFAYGQTSSGKTYTMTGTSDEPGIIPMAVQDLFDIINHRKDRDFLVRASYIEIYNESVIDLLHTANTNVKIQNNEYGIKVDVTERVTTNPNEVLSLMTEGERNRHIGSTNMNERSSRSHTIFQITIESREHSGGDDDDTDVGCVNVSQLNLVDLAGSERAHQSAADNMRFKEGTHINLSLTQLGLVIKQLSEIPKPKFINYRDSKLTRILQNSLGGNAKTSIICAVTPAAMEETTSTLQFANRAKSIKNKPEVNAVATAAADNTMIQKLTKKLSLLQAELVNKKTVEADNQVLLKKIKKMQCQILNGIYQKSISDASQSRRKTWCAPRRQTLHAIPEDGTSSIQRFCTPAMKYNPLTIDVNASAPKERLKISIDSSRKATPVTEREKKVNFQKEVINLDSDDDESHDKENKEECSPMHNKCYDVTKTPPCELRKRVRLYEKEYNEIVEMTELEKIYPPEINELTEQLSDCTLKITSLEDICEEKDIKIKDLNDMLTKSTNEIKDILKLKDDLEMRCKEYYTKLTDIEVSYETLKKKKDLRERELLSLLEDKKEASATVAGKEVDKESSNLLEFEFSLVGSDNESNVNCNDDNSAQVHNIVSDIQTQLSNKSIIVLEKDAEIQQLKEQIDSLTNKNTKLEEKNSSFVEDKELLLKIKVLEETIITLNTTIQNQKQDLESANNDIKSYNDVIHELRLSLSKKDNIPNLDEHDVELLIANEQAFLANNENLNNIILTLKSIINLKNKELNDINIQRTNEQSLKLQECELKSTHESQVIQQLTESIGNTREEIDLLSTENVKLVNRNTELENINEKHESVLKCKQNEIETLNITLSETKNRNLELEKICTNLNDQLKTHEEKVSYLRETISNSTIQYEKQESKWKCKLNEIDKLNTILDETKNELLNKVQTLQEENSKLNTSLSQAFMKIDAFGKENHDLKSEISKLKDENEKIKKESTDKQARVEKISNKNKDLLQKIDILTNKVQTLEENVQQNQNININLKQEKEIDACLAKIKLVGKRIQNLLLTLIGSKAKYEIIPENVLDSDIIMQGISNFVDSLEFALTEIVAEKEKIIDENNTLSEELVSNKLKFENQIQEFISKYNEEKGKMFEEISSLKEEIETKSTLVSQLKQKISEAINDNKHLHESVKDKEKTLSSMISNESDLNSIIEQLKDMLLCREEELQTKILELEDAYISKITMLEKAVVEKNSEIMDLNDKLSQLKAQYTESEERSQEKYSKENIQMEEKLQEASIEISRLVVENLNLLKQSSKLNSNLQKVSTEVSEMEHDTKSTTVYLKECNVLIEGLHKQLMDKIKELDILENNTKLYKDEITNTLKAMETTINELQSENTLLKKENLAKSPSQNTSISSLDCFSSKEYLKIENKTNSSSPPSLISICCNTISDVLIGSTNVTNNVVQDDICLVAPNNDKEEISSLKLRIEILESENKDLLIEQVKVREELKMLIGPVQDLEKKVFKHRTHLSTLTATNYAENKLLSSQVKVLHYLNKKLMNIYDKDLPTLKRQLHALLSILRANPMLSCAKLTPNIKRFSLPNALDENESLSILTNESTLDGDLLMLDNYITLDDSYLDGHDQTCYDDNQSCLNELDQKVGEIADSIPNLVKGHMQALDDQMNVLRQENCELKEQIKRYSLIDQKCSQHMQIETDRSCKNCSDKEVILLKLEIISDQKNKLEAMIDQIHSATSHNILETTLKSLEKKYSVKLAENQKNVDSINKKNEEIKVLQLENISLSNDLMDRIHEIEELNKQYENVIAINSELKKCIEELKSKPTLINTNYNSACTANNEEVKRSNVEYSRTPSKIQSKFHSLQHELDASREDCKKVTEEVATIRNQLERNNMSLTNKIDPDVSMGETTIFHITKGLHSPESTFTEDRVFNSYNTEKVDCLNFLIDKTGIEKENLNHGLNIFDIMKMLYNDLVAKHGQEVENLHNKLRNLEGNKEELIEQINAIKLQNTKIQNQLHVNQNDISKLNNFIKDFNESLVNLSINCKNISSDDGAINLAKDFKDNCLCFIDNQFSTDSKGIFETLLDSLTSKYEHGISSLKSQYLEAQENIKKLSIDLKCVEDKLQKVAAKFTAKEEEFNLLQKQKIKVHEISNAVTLNIIKKEKELCGVITDGVNKLFKYNILPPDNIDTSNVVPQNVTDIFDRLINQIQVNSRSIEAEKEELQLHVKKSETLLKERENDLALLKEEHIKLVKINDEQIEGNREEINKGNKSLLEEIEHLKQIVSDKQQVIDSLEKSQAVIQNKLIDAASLTSEIEQLRHELAQIQIVNKTIIEENNSNNKELEKCALIINSNKNQIEDMNIEICRLEQSVQEKHNMIEQLKSKDCFSYNNHQELTEKLTELEKTYQEKCKEYDILIKSNKTHENTVRVQINIIKRLRSENESTKSTLQEKEQLVEEMTNQCKLLQDKCNVLERNLEQSNNQCTLLQDKCNVLERNLEQSNNQCKLLQDKCNVLERNLEQSNEKKYELNEERNNLEFRAEAEAQFGSSKARTSLDKIGDNTRRRRQSFYDSRRMFEDGGFDTSKADAVFSSRGKPDDLFVDTEDTNSSRSTPTLLNKCDSLRANKSGDRDGGSPVPGNTSASRLRRQSFHDQHRTLPNISPRESINPVLQDGAGDLSEISRLRSQLALCQQELNELKEKYRELDEECETCSQYLQERDIVCAELNKEKRQLEQTVQELRQKIDGYNSTKKTNTADVSVNTDEDWSNLHSIVVDRMSFDVEVEKNQKLTKSVEELRYKNYELKNTVAKLQRALAKYSNRDQTGLKQEVLQLKEELKKHKELVSEMGSSRHKRQSVHDHNRLQTNNMVDAHTAICDDLLSTQVEKDQTLEREENLREIRRLKKNVEELSRQKYEMEEQLATLSAQSVNVATGSGIIKDQQLSDALKANHKLKKMNAKLIELCEKRKNKNREKEPEPQE